MISIIPPPFYWCVFQAWPSFPVFFSSNLRFFEEGIRKAIFLYFRGNINKWITVLQSIYAQAKTVIDSSFFLRL